ncbi:hypothetical protein SE1UMMC_07930 [Staphylococcus epidermidis]|uniref:hypothetical protein n=1 Tax=Staphylococcus epidermidis TaxID=1282 RepID=UPI000C7A76E5|nr:hypothetical protein [Staphylococcus epidermidis]AUJ74299.1 hypothetical protein SE1UMMC_07930 [Staphylococcus epidermidis]
MNKDNFSKNTAILVILGSIILVIISSYLAIGEITKFKNVKGILQIIISIVGLFATFGGAYLGAKISGDNAKELFEKDIKIRDIENHLSVNLNVLEKINVCKDKLVEVNNTLEDEKFYHPCNFKKYKENIESVSNLLNEIQDKYINCASLIINMDFDSLYNFFQEVYETKYIIKTEKTQAFLLNYFDKQQINSETRMWHDFAEYNSTSNDCIFPNIIDIPAENNEGISVKEIYEDNSECFESIKKELQNSVKKWLEQYEIMEFKTKEDIYRIYKEVRM